MKNTFLIIILALIFISSGCHRKVDICYFPYNNDSFEYSVIDSIILNEPNEYIIKGKILEDKNPLIGVQIYFSTDPKTVFATISEIDGSFNLTFQLGNKQRINGHHLHFDYTGYRSLEVALEKIINKEILVEVR